MNRSVWIALLTGLALASGCHKAGPDPLQVYEKALEEVQEAPLPENWPAETTLVLGDAMIQAAFSDAADLMLAELPPDLELHFLAATLRLTPGIVRTGSRLEASAECESCLEARIDLRGDTVLELSNPTGKMTRSMTWTGTAWAIYRVDVVREPRGDIRIVAAPEKEDQWDIDLKFEKEESTIPVMLLEPAEEHLRRLVASGRRFSLELARLEHDSRISLRGIRVRPIPEGVALDQAYTIVDPVAVGEPLPDPGQGWVAVVPGGTLLALIRAAIFQGDPPEGARLEPSALRLQDEGFELEMLIHPDKWPRKPILLLATGTFGINEDNELALLSLDARPVKGRFANPKALMVRVRMKEQIAKALEASIPVSADRALGPGRAKVVITDVRSAADRLYIRGEMAVVE